MDKDTFNIYLGWLQVSGTVGTAIGFLATGALLSLWIDLGPAPKVCRLTRGWTGGGEGEKAGVASVLLAAALRGLRA